MKRYALGLDYGTNSVRALVVDVSNGAEVGTGVWNYESGEAGIVLDSRDTNLSRQNPRDYVIGAEQVSRWRWKTRRPVGIVRLIK